MRKTLWLLASAGVLLLPGSARGQAVPLSPLGSFWITPYLGFGFQGEYHNAVVFFADGGQDLLRLDPGSAIVLGAQFGYRLHRSLTAQANLSYSNPGAVYVEDVLRRPDVGVTTIQFELGILYDVSTFPVAGKLAPFLIGGGLSVTRHSFDPFQWSGNFIEPNSTSIGLHGLAALDIPLAPKVSFRGQAKLTASSLALGDLNNRIAFAEGTAISRPLDAGIHTYLMILAGVTIRL